MRAKIISFTCKLFVRYGIRAVTVDTIAYEMGISKRTIYEQFSSKEEILSECMWQHFACSHLLETGTGRVADELTALYIRMKDVNPVGVSRFCHELYRSYHSLYQKLLGRIHDYALNCSLKTDRDIDDGYIRKDIHRDMVYTLVKSYLMQFFSDIQCRNEKLCEVSSSEIMVIFARGLSTIKGRAYLEQKLKEITQ